MVEKDSNNADELPIFPELDTDSIVAEFLEIAQNNGFDEWDKCAAHMIEDALGVDCDDSSCQKPDLDNIDYEKLDTIIYGTAKYVCERNKNYRSDEKYGILLDFNNLMDNLKYIKNDELILSMITCDFFLGLIEEDKIELVEEVLNENDGIIDDGDKYIIETELAKYFADLGDRDIALHYMVRVYERCGCIDEDNYHVFDDILQSLALNEFESNIQQLDEVDE